MCQRKGEQLMPVKRRLSKQVDGRITPTVVAAYAHALEVRKRNPGSEEQIEAEKVVERALQIRMWETSVFDVDFFRDDGSDDWARAKQLRQQLDAALRQRQATAPAPTAA
jgi:hypothetical protein